MTSRRSIVVLALSIHLCAAPLLGYQPRTRGQAVASRPTTLAQLLRDRLPQGVQCGARVVDLRDGKVVFERDAALPLIPASNAKILTLAAALDQLGESFAFRTPLLLCGRDLVVIGDGDPGTGDPTICQQAGEPIDAAFNRWADALRARGIESIDGDLVFDDSIFESTLAHPTWDVDDLQKWFAAPVGGLCFNDNVIQVTVWPDDKAGAPVEWEVSPKCGLVRIDNRAKSGAKNECVISRPNSDFRYVLSGTCAARGTLAEVTVPDPGLFFGDVLRGALAAKGIRVHGEIVRRRVRMSDGKLPPDCELVATHQTPLPAVLARIGKNSQNLFAECVFKRLGYEYAKAHGDRPAVGSWESGRAAIEAFLHKVEPGRWQVDVADASGLSRDNRASAADFTRILAYMYHSSNRQRFVDSLSDGSGGEDNSLKGRLKDLNGSVYAKTGYIRGVRTLSGYLVTPRGDWLAFSVLFNGIKGGTAPLNAIHVEFCRILTAYNRESSE